MTVSLDSTLFSRFLRQHPSVSFAFLITYLNLLMIGVYAGIVRHSPLIIIVCLICAVAAVASVPYAARQREQVRRCRSVLNRRFDS